MCSITGWIDWEEDLTGQGEVLSAMTETLARRGPDAFGTWISRSAALGHRRLIVVDPAGGEQPMVRVRGDRTYVLVYNGELYNTAELRRDLEGRGYTFRGHSDTEALLLSFLEWGPECVERFNGIIPAGTPVRVRLVDAVTAETAQSGDTITYEVSQNVLVDGVIVIPAGARGTAHVVAAKPSGPLGRAAELELDFCTVTGVDGVLLPMASSSAKFAPHGAERSRALAAGAGMAGMALLGPVGAAGSVLVKGPDLVFPAGTEFELVTAARSEVIILDR